MNVLRNLPIALLLTLSTAFANPAGAAAWPAYAPLPDGFTLQSKGGYAVAFGHEEFHYPPPNNQPSVNVTIDGPAWKVTAQSADKPPLKPEEVFARFRAALEKEGWSYVSRPPYYVFKRERDGKQSWLQIDGPNSTYVGLRLAEKGSSARTLVIPEPGEKAEAWKANEAPAYLPPYPGATLRKVEIVAGARFEVTLAASDADHLWVGAPMLSLLYDMPADLSPFEFREIYVGALERAGWTIIRKTAGAGSTGDMVFLAHYTKQGRDIWIDGHEYGPCLLHVADLGLQAAANHLKEVLDREGHIALYGIYFDTDKATLKPESEATLRQIEALLRDDTKLQLRVEGHTDNTGTRPHNQTLSEARAASVKAWLVEHGIDAARLTPQGFADGKPVADNSNPEGRAKNRRVELAKG